MPQSALPARIAAARSGPVRHGGSSRRRSLGPAPARVSSTSSSICAPAPGCRTAICAPAARTSARLCRCLGLPGGNQQALFAPHQSDQHGVMQARHRAHRRDIGVLVAGNVIAVEMHRRGDHLAALQAIDAARGAFGERRQTGAGFAQGPFQQIVLAAADNRRRVGGDHAGGTRQSRKHPEIQLLARKQPLAGHLAAGDRARGHEFVELALSEPDIVGSLAGGQKFHPAFICIFLLLFNQLT